MRTFPLISIIISNHNGWRLGLLRSCLESVFKINYPRFEVILVDNASSDESIARARDGFKDRDNFKIIANRVNMYSQGLNMGIEVARGKYLAFFNNDLAVEPNYLKEILGVLEKDESIGLAQGKLLSYNNRTRIDSVGETMDIYGTPKTIGAGEIDKGQYNRIKEILSVSGSASIMRQGILEEIGSFDPQYGIGYEDMDLALRCRLRGYKIVFIPGAIIYHKRGATDSTQEVRLKVRWHFNKNRVATLVKNYSLGNLLKALPVTILLYLLAFLWEALVKREFKLAGTRVSALFWNAKNLKSLLKQRMIVQKNMRRVPDAQILKLLMPRKTLMTSFLWFVQGK